MMVAGFIVVVSKAWDVEPVATASRRSVNAIEMRRSDILLHPRGFGLILPRCGV